LDWKLRGLLTPARLAAMAILAITGDTGGNGEAGGNDAPLSAVLLI